MPIQRGPVYLSESDNEYPTYDGGKTTADKSQYMFAMASFREKARSEAIATARLSVELENVPRYIECLKNKFWDKRRPRFRSSLTDNRLNNSRKNDLALLTDSRPTVTVTSQIEAYKRDADIVQGVIGYEWSHQNMDTALIRVVDITKLHGTGFWKHFAATPGISRVGAFGPDQVMPIQPQFDLQESTAILFRTWKSVASLCRKYWYAADKIRMETPFNDASEIGASGRFNRPNHIEQVTWNGLSPQMQRIVGVDASAAASSMTGTGLAYSLEVQEYWVDDISINESARPVLMRNPYCSLQAHNYWYWVKPGQMLYPRKRLIVYAGRTLVYDGPSPFWHGKYPFSCLRLDPFTDSFWGLSKYRDLLPLNEAMNEIVAGVMDNVKTILNPTPVAKMNAMPKATWDAFYPGMPQAKLLLFPTGNPAEVRYLEGPQIPAWVMQVHQYLSQEFDRISGAIDIMNLGKKKQVPGADTVESMREAMNTVTRLEGRYIEKFLQDAGEIAVSDILQHYELPVLIRMLGEKGLSLEMFNRYGPNLIPDGAPKEDHWRHYALKVDAGSLLSNQKDREKQLAVALAEKGLIAIKTLHERLGLPPQAYKDLLEENKEGIHASGRSSRTGRGQRTGKAA